MSGYESDRETDYDYFKVQPKLGWNDQPVESKNGKSRLLIFLEVDNAEIWVPKKVSKFKKHKDGAVVAQIETWWVKKQDELS